MYILNPLLSIEQKTKEMKYNKKISDLSLKKKGENANEESDRRTRTDFLRQSQPMTNYRDLKIVIGIGDSLY